VATVASFNSAFMCLAVDPDDLLKSKVRPMVMALPETWDETIVLGQSKIGDLAVFARRKGKEWFLSALNGAKRSRQIKVKLDFLKRGKYSIDMLKDNLQDPLKAELVTKTVQRKNQLTIELAGGGGFVGRISAVK
ncbi:MAG TPA: glycoside hydrolase family 97 C-terminal domain-containing protein, partial [Arachidicoccus sp.]|nr:glycoside hydrolase family 97 C-terminal domain-containing protein [Arachidicoccus sp.]